MACFTVCIPSYNSALIVGETLQSLLKQTFTDWECLVIDDASTDGTQEVVRRFKDPRIQLIENAKNVGYPGNLQRCFDLANGKYLYLLGNDDILSPVALELTYSAFQLAPDVALVTRPYYWFEDDESKPVRYSKQFDPTGDRVISIKDDASTLTMLYSTLAQLSGLAFRRDAIAHKVNPYVFPAHVQPFLATFRSYRAVFLKDYPVAIRIAHSQTRHVSSIYNPSPLWSWMDMFETVFPGRSWQLPKTVGQKFVSKNVEGLIQIRCYSTFGCFLREAWLHLYYRPMNFITWRWWLYVIGCLAIPPLTLRKLVDKLMPFFMKPRTGDVALAQQ